MRFGSSCSFCSASRSLNLISSCVVSWWTTIGGGSSNKAWTGSSRDTEQRTKKNSNNEDSTSSWTLFLLEPWSGETDSTECSSLAGCSMVQNLYMNTTMTSPETAAITASTIVTASSDMRNEFSTQGSIYKNVSCGWNCESHGWRSQRERCSCLRTKVCSLAQAQGALQGLLKVICLLFSIYLLLIHE